MKRKHFNKQTVSMLERVDKDLYKKLWLAGFSKEFIMGCVGINWKQFYFLEEFLGLATKAADEK